MKPTRSWAPSREKLVGASISPVTDANGVPWCGTDSCHLYDGKHCLVDEKNPRPVDADRVCVVKVIALKTSLDAFKKMVVELRARPPGD